MDHATLRKHVETLWEDRASLSPQTKGEARDVVEAALAGLDNGTFRVAEQKGEERIVHEWLKKAVLMSFRLYESEPMAYGCGGAPGFDKVPLKFAGWGKAEFEKAGFRAVPGAV
ncbi:MAG: 2,3,4,5-tetrahydropyridine-2,6-dicarboxylate N-succinyltransferase, partial [Bombella apis]|nr:2,3,4,5-tetrahydropyridine-2,6-dicarboxylate N-succinyltransferase [Bombella apis]